MYYFAYGSNLDIIQMKKRCPDSQKIGSILLEDYKLLFRSHNGKYGYLTITENEKSHVPIGIYKISQTDEKNLDRYEGVWAKLYRKKIISIKQNGEYIQGLVYIMNGGVALPPNNDYYLRVESGYNEFNFDVKHLIDAYNECTLRLLEILERKITEDNISQISYRTKGWRESGVIITDVDDEKRNWVDGNQTHVIILKNCYRELSWLFERLHDVFYNRIDYITKYNFYSLLAIAANTYITNSQKDINMRHLLLDVLRVAKEALTVFQPIIK